MCGLPVLFYREKVYRQKEDVTLFPLGKGIYTMIFAARTLFKQGCELIPPSLPKQD
jgi:hypothetical protein